MMVEKKRRLLVLVFGWGAIGALGKDEKKRARGMLMLGVKRALSAVY